MGIIKTQNILEISITLSIFFGLLYGVVWLKNRKNSEHFWFSLLYWCNVCYAFTRLCQFQDLGILNSAFLPRIILSSLVVLTWLSYKFVYALISKELSKSKTHILNVILFFLIMATWFTDWVLTSIPLQRINIAGEVFSGVQAGPAFSVFVLSLQAFVWVLIFEIARMKNLKKRDQQMIIVGFTLFILMGFNDAILTAFNLKWIRLFDMAYLPIGFLYTFVQFNQYARLHYSLEDQVDKKTKDLQYSNQQLVDSEKRYREIFEHGSDWIYIHDLQGNIKEENFRFKKEFFNERSQLKGLYIQDLVVEKYQHEVEKYLNELQEKGHARGIVSLQTQDNKRVVLEYRSILLTGENNKIPAEVRGSAREITGEIKAIYEKKRLEENLRQSQKMESIGTLAGGVAHDFNNVLSMILGNAELALEDIEKVHPVREYLKEIKSASVRAAGIIKQLLNFSRKANARLKSVDAVSMIDDILIFLRSGIPATIEIKKQLPSSKIMILADSIQINRLLINLCTNATQAMGLTGGLLKISIKKIKVNENNTHQYPNLKPQQYLSLEIKDNGPGIGIKNLDRIFDPYFTTKTVGEGSGLGLAVAHGIVKNHNGDIYVDSKVGIGTTFTILLPCTDKISEEEQIKKEQRLNGNERILFVDDEPAIINLTSRMLQKMGYMVSTNVSPQKALEEFRSTPHAFDLVITDMTMPEMTGLELFEQLRQIRPGIPVIISTGHSVFIDKQKAQKMGVSGYVTKPISMTELSQEIRRVCDGV